MTQKQLTPLSYIVDQEDEVELRLPVTPRLNPFDTNPYDWDDARTDKNTWIDAIDLRRSIVLSESRKSSVKLQQRWINWITLLLETDTYQPTVTIHSEPDSFASSWWGQPNVIILDKVRKVPIFKDQNDDFVNRAILAETDDRIDDAIDIIYNGIDYLLRDGKFSECNSVLDKIDVDFHSLDIILSLLTATLPVRSRFKARKKLLQNIEAKLRKTGKYKESILTGL